MSEEEKKKIISVYLQLEVDDLLDLIFILKNTDDLSTSARYTARVVLSSIEDALS